MGGGGGSRRADRPWSAGEQAEGGKRFLSEFMKFLEGFGFKQPHGCRTSLSPS